MSVDKRKTPFQEDISNLSKYKCQRPRAEAVLTSSRGGRFLCGYTPANIAHVLEGFTSSEIIDFFFFHLQATDKSRNILLLGE